MDRRDREQQLRDVYRLAAIVLAEARIARARRRVAS